MDSMNDSLLDCDGSVRKREELDENDVDITEDYSKKVGDMDDSMAILNNEDGRKKRDQVDEDITEDSVKKVEDDSMIKGKDEGNEDCLESSKKLDDSMSIVEISNAKRKRGVCFEDCPQDEDMTESCPESSKKSRMDIDFVTPLKSSVDEVIIKKSVIDFDLNMSGKSDTISFEQDSITELFTKETPAATFTVAQREVLTTKTTITQLPLNDSPLKKSSIESNLNIIKAIQKSDQDPNLIGDYSEKFALPLERGKHADLKNISAETLSRVICGEFKEKVDYTIVDCRFPYEYEGGHIKGGKNIYTEDGILREFFPENRSQSENKRHIIVFHCEFSSKRGPKLLVRIFKILSCTK